MRTPQARHQQLGISLMEAIVAMAVMAFGMVGMVGLQSTLRGNADIAKQRSEAVRIARTTLETQRGYSVIAPRPGALDFDAIVAPADAFVVGDNATFTLQETVDDVAGIYNPRRKLLRVDVTWNDSAGAQQRVRLPSMLTAVSSELRGSLVTSPEASPVQQVNRRHAGIPPGAVDLEGDDKGKSKFFPPSPALPADRPYWIFSNLTGLITQVCTAAGTCSLASARFALLAGYVRFATIDPPPPAPSIVNPPVDGVGLYPPGALISGLGVTVTQPAPDPSVVCLTEDDVSGGFMRYYCAMELLGPAVATQKWSGQSALTGIGNLAASVADPSATSLRVCRYTSTRAHTAVSATAPVFTNEEHPLNYLNVNRSLDNQNFLVIRAGNGTLPYVCPDGAPATPTLGRTWHHQPAS